MSFANWLSHFDPDSQPPINIYFIGEGIGESILVHIPNQFVMVVDCHGGKSTSSMDYLLNSLGITQINLLVLTHLHYDHYSGLKVLLEKYDVCSFAHSYSLHWDNTLQLSKLFELKKFGDTIPKETNLTSLVQTISKVKKNKWSKDLVNCYKHINNSSTLYASKIAGTDVVIDCIAPLADIFDDSFYKQLEKNIEKTKKKGLDYLADAITKKHNTKMNETCSIIRIRYGNSLVLLTADSENKTLNEINNSNLTSKLTEIKSILIKIPHHGSDTSGSKFLFDKQITESKKMYGVITPNTGHGLPLSKIVDTYKQSGYAVFKTAQSTIAFTQQDENAPTGAVMSAVLPDGNIKIRTYGKAVQL
jgi:beta-lactamase superfamily II metal-dependent hydrolase